MLCLHANCAPAREYCYELVQGGQRDEVFRSCQEFINGGRCFPFPLTWASIPEGITNLSVPHRHNSEGKEQTEPCGSEQGTEEVLHFIAGAMLLWNTSPPPLSFRSTRNETSYA